MSTDSATAPASERDMQPFLAFVHDLLALPASHVNLERSGGRRRLRFKIADPTTGRVARRALELPDDDHLITSLADILRDHRRNPHENRAATSKNHSYDERLWRKHTRKRLLAACPHGRVAKRRLALVFELAADLGHGFLIDFMKRLPWLAKSPSRAGRPCK